MVGALIELLIASVCSTLVGWTTLDNLRVTRVDGSLDRLGIYLRDPTVDRFGDSSSRGLIEGTRCGLEYRSHLDHLSTGNGWSHGARVASCARSV